MGKSNIIIGILDSGIPMLNGALSHPDLDDTNKIIIGEDETGDGEGVRDLYGHGTHVAGILSAETNNSVGIAGVADGCKIMVVQVFDSFGGGDWSWFKEGVIYAVDNGAKVINFSGGGYFASQQAYDALAYANSHNVFIAAAVGNDYADSILYPAAYSTTFTNLVAVGATDQNDSRSPYSNVGSQLNVVAPGGYGGTLDANDIYSTTPNYPFYLEAYSITQNYGYMAGTSMATPHVAGIAALILSINPNLTPSQVRTIIERTAEDKGVTGFDIYYGYGRVNAARAVKTVVAPTNLHFANSSGYVTIAWDPHPSPILSYYSIERKINYGSWTVIATTTSTSFTDPEVRFSTDPSRPMVYYRITAISTGNIQSLYSTVISTRGQYIPFNTNEQFVALPSEFRFEQNVPNPFNPSTELRFDLPEQSTVVLRIYNSIGQEVAELINGVRAAGKHSIRWNASTLPSGMYFARLSVGNKSYVKRMLLLK